jgi:alanine racemase
LQGEKNQKMTLQQIAQIIAAKLAGKPDVEIAYLLTDSRTLSFPEETLFFALKTAKNDGHHYIEELYQRGVRNFVVGTKNFPSLPDANFLVVENPLVALQALVAVHRAQFSCPVIGITGSNGKTIVKEWLYQLLQADYRITRSPRSYNSQIGVPLSVWEMSPQTELGIFEAGISRVGEMAKLQPIIRPTIGVFTHLGDAHQENFSSMKEKINEKLQLFIHSEAIIYEKDNKLLDIAVQQSGLKAKSFTWGKTAEADVQIIEQKTEAGKTAITYSCPKFVIPRSSFLIPFTDIASIENALSCLTTMLYLGKSSETIAERMATLEPVAMRLEMKEGLNNCLIIDDSYNSDLSSLGIALDFLVEQAAAKQMKRTLILSDILQSGQKAKELYRIIAELILNKGVNKFIGIGEEIYNLQSIIYDYLEGKCEMQFFKTTDDFLNNQLSNNQFNNEAVLLKGARSFHFEDISEKLEAIAHQTTLEVDLTALVHNVDYFRSFLKPETKLMSMVKAYAYGSGDIEVARTLQSAGVQYLAVAVADEGVALRNEGIHIPIVVMNPEIGAFGKIFDYRLEPEIYSFRLLEAFRHEAARRGETSYPVHIKIDTGMNRLGFSPQDVDELISTLKAQQTLAVRSVFSHLVGSDEAQFDSFTQTQVERFTAAAEKFEKAFTHKILKHILNSAGIERFPQYQFDMVRLGIGHYGISAVDNARLEEVCTLKSSILQIRRVPATETVGYCRKGKLQRDSLIGVIPVGYADGYDRHLGNGVGKVLVKGQLAPIVGNVCMDICMIDLTDIPAVKEGDAVILFGKEYSINNIARSLQTIAYEVLTGISRRVKRIYFKE